MDIQYYASRRDTIELAEFLTREFACTFYADHSPTAEPLKYVSEAAIRTHIASVPVPSLLHVTSPNWSSSSVQMSGPFIRGNAEPYWYVSQRHGGPAFIWSLPGECNEGERKWLRLGMFGDWPTYYFGPDNVEHPRPAAMTAAYQGISKQIRRGAKRTRWEASGRAGPWISRDAIRLSSAGFSVGEGISMPVHAKDRPLNG